MNEDTTQNPKPNTVIIRKPNGETTVHTEAEVLPSEKESSAPAARILQIFFDVNLNKAHEGLGKLAMEHGIDVRNLMPGQYVMFINKQRTTIKLYTTNNVIAHWVHPKRHVLDASALRYIPAAFNATGKISYNLALEKAVKEKLTKYKRGRKAKKVTETEVK